MPAAAGNRLPSCSAGWLSLALLATTAALAAAGKFDHLATCEDCIAAGLGWSDAKSKCGGYANKACAGGNQVAAGTVGEAVGADEEAAALEAARGPIDAANMAEAKELALTSPHTMISQAAPVQQCGKVIENQAMTLRCPGANIVESVEFASYGTPTGGCRRCEFCTKNDESLLNMMSCVLKMMTFVSKMMKFVAPGQAPGRCPERPPSTASLRRTTATRMRR